MGIFSKIIGDANEKYIKSLTPLVEQINEFEKKISQLSDDELKAQTQKFKDLLSQGKGLDDILPEAFATVREAAKRTLGIRHYDVQLMAGVCLHRGQIAEQKTGEGKTLSATTALYLNSLTGNGCHLVTVNDYLSRRDCGWMGPIYHALGVSVGVVIHEGAFVYDPDYTNENAKDEKLVHLKQVPRKDAYRADITYGTNNEFGFDYLRDNMVGDIEMMVQRELNYAIVDEVDSILIDEARTPLIISSPDADSTDKYYKFAKLVVQLKEDEDYNIDEKMRAATLTDEGINKIEKWLGLGNIYTDAGISEVHHIEQALRAHALFKRDRDYVVKDGEVIIVDEFTGRMMYGRRYSEGLHQAIEAKEGVAVQKESRTLATVTFQNLFRLYNKLAGMTGTAATEAEEFSKIYKLDVTVIPTNKGMARKDLPDKIFKNEEGKFKAVIQEVKHRHELGQPVLIGTISIEKNELLGELLRREGIEVQILNAKFHEKEAHIIANAGKLGAVTVATNMAGRGVDIKLGGEDGNKEEEIRVRDLGGLCIIGTERHESRRIDNQLRGRGGRQGDPGLTQFYVSVDDDLMRIFGGQRIKKMMETLKVPDDMPIENRLISKSLESAQKKVEGYHFDTRKNLVEYDDVLNKHRETIYKKRRQVLDMQDLKAIVLDLVLEEITEVVNFHTASADENTWDLNEIYEVISTIFIVNPNLRLKLNEIASEAGNDIEDNSSRGKLIGYIYRLAVETYNDMEEKVVKVVGKDDAMRQIEKGIALRSIDTLWIEHLDAIDHLRTGIGLRGYGQRDPLIEYKRESFGMFKELLVMIRKQIVYAIFKAGFAANFVPTPSTQPKNLVFNAPSAGSGLKSSIAQIADQTPQDKQAKERAGQDSIDQAQTHYNGVKVGRNDLCPCGSGKKFKQCHGK